MKKNILKAFAPLLVVLLLCVTLALPASAAEETRDYTWSISEDYNIVSDGYDTYTYLDLPPSTYWNPTGKLYQHDAPNRISGLPYENTLYEIATPFVGSGILHLETFDFADVYVTNAARAKLEAEFFNEQNVLYRLCDSAYIDMQSDLSAETVAALRDLTATERVEASSLRRLDAYEVVYYDSTESFYTVCGMIFVDREDRLLFVDYSDLDNTHFDAYENLSFRSGTLPVSVLDAGALADTVRGAMDGLETRYPDVSYEANVDVSGFLAAVTVPVFWVLYALSGFILPLAPLALGILYANSKKHGKHPRWYALTALAAVWLILSTVIFIILVV